MVNKLFLRVGLVASAVLLAISPVSANCLAQSQNAIAAVQLANAYSISSYTWQGDPQYDQVMPLCSKTAIREFSCNAAFNLALRQIEDKTVENKPKATHLTCVANYLGALAFGLYTRHAFAVQILHVRF